MFSNNLFLLLILLTPTAADASLTSRTTDKATLGFVTTFNENGTHNFTKENDARAQALKQGGRKWTSSIANQFIFYTAEIGVGSPPTNYTLRIDTATSNTWVGAEKTYAKTKSSHDTGHSVALSYHDGQSFAGEEWIDTVTFFPGLAVANQSIGVAHSSPGFTGSGLDGILGLGPVDLTQNTVRGVQAVPTVMDNLMSEGKVSEDVLGFYFVPVANRTKHGELTLGGYDERVTTTPVHYVPLTKSFPDSTLWGIDQSVGYGAETILPWTSGFIDTGTSLVYLATDAFEKYQDMTGAIFDTNVGLFSITPKQYAKLQSLTFHIGSHSFVLSPNAQIWPRSLNYLIRGNADSVYLMIGNLGVNYPKSFRFIIGYPFLERYYCVLDATNKRVGFAETKYTFAKSN